MLGEGCWLYQLVHHNMNVMLADAWPQILGPLDVEMVAYLHNDLVTHGMDVIVNDGIQLWLMPMTHRSFPCNRARFYRQRN